MIAPAEPILHLSSKSPAESPLWVFDCLNYGTLLYYPPVDTVYITTLYSLILLRASRVTRRASRITKVKTCMRRAQRQVFHTFPA